MVSEVQFINVVSFHISTYDGVDGEIRLFSAQHIVKVDGKTGIFRGLSPRIASSVISTVVRGKVRQVKL